MQFSIRQLGLVTTYIALGMWAVTTAPAFGIVLPTLLAAIMTAQVLKRFEAVAFGIFSANFVGIVSILATRWVLLRVYPQNTYPLQDDAWRNELIQWCGVAGLLGALVGTVIACAILYRLKRAVQLPQAT